MRVLAIDTTTTWASVAVVEERGVRGELRLADVATHSSTLLPSVEFLLAQLGLGVADVDALAVVTGPGSFTGLRIGLSTVQGLALATGRPCLGISGLDLIGWRLRARADFLVALIDAHRDEVYAACYDGQARPVGEAGVGRLSEVLAKVPPGAAYGGPDVARLEETLRARDPEACFPPCGPYQAASLGRWALERLADGARGSPAELRACYVRKPRVRTG